MPPDRDAMDSSPTQDAMFVESEGDRWFGRNVSGMVDEKRVAEDFVVRSLVGAGVEPREVLEIGASNGFRLHALHQLFHCRVTAVEPSPAAIADGRRRFPEIEFAEGVAAALPIENGRCFDLVIVNFVFHWIDRSTLFRSVSEIDRVVAGDGYLVIGDFLPDAPERVVYHHLPSGSMWTYKQDYAELYLASQLYRRVDRQTLEIGTRRRGSDIAPSARAAVCLLRKVGDAGYVTRESPHGAREGT